MSEGTGRTGNGNPTNSTRANGEAHGNNTNGRRRNNRQRYSTTGVGTTGASRFKGGVEHMDGHVFQCSGENPTPTQYERTVEELMKYVSTNCKHPGDVQHLIKNLEE